jgi:adenylate cyclase class IV
LNEAVILVIKASVDDTTSENGIARVEREIVFPQKTLAELDAIVRSAGYEYQAKWSRDREEYKTEDAITVTIDRNAGYGYVAEFEKVVDAAEKVSEAQKDIRALMEKIGVEELSQDRLERMFAYYNEHWEEYYGTDKTFVVT